MARTFLAKYDNCTIANVTIIAWTSFCFSMAYRSSLLNSRTRSLDRMLRTLLSSTVLIAIHANHFSPLVAAWPISRLIQSLCILLRISKDRTRDFCLSTRETKVALAIHH